MFHNLQNERLRQETLKVKQMYAADPGFKYRITQNDPQLAQALESGNNSEVEKIIKERMKVMFDKQRAEQEKLARLQNADPNDIEA